MEWYNNCIRCKNDNVDVCSRCINHLQEPDDNDIVHYCENLCETCKQNELGCYMTPSAIGYDDKGNKIVVACNSYYI